MSNDQSNNRREDGMPDHKSEGTSLFKSVASHSVTLGIFAVLTVGLIANTYVFTKDKIEAQIRAFEAKALKEILSEDKYDNNLLDTKIVIPANEQLVTQKDTEAYVAFKNKEPVAVILPAVAPDGYNGRIDLLVGIYSDGSLAGVRATNHKETPGLGDKIDTKVSDWIFGFAGKSLENPKGKGWNVKKDGGDFDQFTGATITPRAVVASVHRALEYFKANKDHLFNSGFNVLNSAEVSSNE